jgi:hypothetical protein
MSEQSLDLVKVDSPLHQSGCERMAQVMEAEIRNARSIASLAKFPTQKPHLKFIAEW